MFIIIIIMLQSNAIGMLDDDDDDDEEGDPVADGGYGSDGAVDVVEETPVVFSSTAEVKESRRASLSSAAIRDATAAVGDPGDVHTAAPSSLGIGVSALAECGSDTKDDET